MYLTVSVCMTEEVENHSMWILETELQPLEDQRNTFNHRAVSPAPGRKIFISLRWGNHRQSEDQNVCFIRSRARDVACLHGHFGLELSRGHPEVCLWGLSWECEVGRHTLSTGGTDWFLHWGKRSELSLGFISPCFLRANAPTSHSLLLQPSLPDKKEHNPHIHLKLALSAILSPYWKEWLIKLAWEITALRTCSGSAI